MGRKRADNVKKTEAPGNRKSRGRFWRYCFVLLLTGTVVLAWLSMLTFSPDDPPSPTVYPPKHPVDNSAGIVGAYTSHYLRYWLGRGVYMGLVFATVAAGLLLFGGAINYLLWRTLGLAFLITTTSVAAYLMDPVSASDVTNGKAGILGAGVGELLFAKFGPTGSWLILIVAFCTGLMLAADHLVLQIPRLGKKMWQNRGELPRVMSTLRIRPVSSESQGLPVRPRAAAVVPATAKPTAKPIPRPAPVAKPVPIPAPVPAPTPAATVQPKSEPKPKPEPKGDEKSKVKKGLAALLPFTRQQAKPKLKPDPKPLPKTSVSEGAFALPSSELLAEPTTGYIESQESQAAHKRSILQQTLNDFNVAAEVVGHQTGPVITLFELTLAPGVKVSQISNLATDIARALAVPGVRIVSPIPGKDTVGIEVPNMDKEIVRIKELMQLANDADKKMYLPLYLGKDAGGDAIVADLAGMPHILLAGTTGSGKSVCMNTIIMSLLMTRRPEDVRFILIDPKMVEMAAFEKIPHLLCPIVNDMRRAEEILEWATVKMDERYELLKEAGVKNIAGYNRLSKQEIYERFHVESPEEQARIPLHMPYYVIMVDELADLMMTSSKEVENHIIRIAQKARAVGIHLVLATQRPSVNVVTGLIKSNMPCRISFRVASRQESRIVLDQNGADVLLGQGDMLFLQPGTSNLIRAQGTYVDDTEIRSVVSELTRAGEPQYNVELVKLQSKTEGGGSGERDELFDKAVEIILASQRGSVSLLQRRLQIGYSRSSRIIDQMADAGILGEYKGSQARECLMTLEDWQALQATIAADRSGESSRNGEPTTV